MKNSYEIRGEVTVIFINTKNFGTLETTISTEKLERLLGINCSLSVNYHKPTKSFYVALRVVEGGGAKRTSLHRVVAYAPKGLNVDHIDHNTLNNVDSNLRLLTNAENQQNRKGATIRSTTGILGVTYIKSTRKWHARIGLHGERLFIGSFEDKHEAEKAIIAARKNFMPYSKQNDSI